jgi:uncharacterized phage infection (PIP) family protein YhgE
MKPLLLVPAVGLALVVADCGESGEDKAKNDVCDARADIQRQVNDLSSLTLATASVDKVKSGLTAIKDDLSKIADAQGKLDERRKQQVQQATETFTSQVNKVANDLKSGQSLQGAATQLKTDLANLANSYKQAFGPVDCS